MVHCRFDLSSRVRPYLWSYSYPFFPFLIFPFLFPLFIFRVFSTLVLVACREPHQYTCTHWDPTPERPPIRIFNRPVSDPMELHTINNNSPASASVPTHSPLQRLPASASVAQRFEPRVTTGSVQRFGSTGRTSFTTCVCAAFSGFDYDIRSLGSLVLGPDDPRCSCPLSSILFTLCSFLSFVFFVFSFTLVRPLATVTGGTRTPRYDTRSTNAARLTDSFPCFFLFLVPALRGIAPQTGLAT